MKKQFLIAILFLCSCGISKKTEVHNSETITRIMIEGTKVSIVPPGGFIQASNFNGLQQNESGSSLMVVEFPQSLYEMKTVFTKEALLTKGIEVSSIEETTIDYFDAFYIKGKQSSMGSTFAKDIVAFGDSKKTILITCATPITMTEIRKEIEKTLFSLQYHEETTLDILTSLDYKINTDSVPFVFAKSVANSIIYTYDGLIPTKIDHKSTVIVSKSHSEVDVEDRKLFSINRIKETPIDIETIDSIYPIIIDDISGYEIFATGKSRNTDESLNIYQVILFSDNMYYIFFATVSADHSEKLVEAKKLIDTFERK